MLLAGAGVSGTALLRRGMGLAATVGKPATCVLTPELEEGPYYVDSELLRRDIREGRPGLPLHLRITVHDKHTCRPLPHAAVDIWHCDAMGIYSGYEKASLTPMGPPGEAGPNGRPPRGPGDRPAGPPRDRDGRPLLPPGGFGGPGGPGGPPRSQITDNDRFLRGVQIADASGVVDFLTIYPGWYQGRDTHIHVKVHIGGSDVLGHDRSRKDLSANDTHVYSGGHVCFTGQIAFDDAWSDRIAKLEPYRRHNLQRTRIDEDGVFEHHGEDVMARLVQMDAKRLEMGISGSMLFAVDPAETWKEQHGPGGAGHPPDGGVSRARNEVALDLL